MVRIGICDDEQYMSDTIRVMVSGFFLKRNIEIIIMQFSSGEELLNYDKQMDRRYGDSKEAAPSKV